MVLLPLLIFTWAAAVSAQPEVEQGFQPMASVDGIPRLPEFDVVQLADGGTLEGSVVNDTLTLHTSYGSILFKTDWLAGVETDRTPGHVDRVATINRNRFSGFLAEAIEFRKSSGETVRLEKVALRRIVFHQRETESDFGATHRFLVLDNGDLLSGRLPGWSVEAKTDAGSVRQSLEDVESAGFAEGISEVQLLLRDGSEATGTMTRDSIRIDLDLGPQLEVPVSHVRTLFARAGLLPSSVRSTFTEDIAATTEPTSSPPGPDPEDMVWIGPGRFRMGCGPGEKGQGSDEGPATEVLITRGFWMGRYEVTQEEYAEVTGLNPSGIVAADHPVEKVTWNEARAFCEKRTSRDRAAGRLPAGFVYRLPTEAEWEYACRAGGTTRFGFGDDPDGTRLAECAWYIRNSAFSTHPVGRLKPNDWGLYDMHGNVWEWCEDVWEDAYPGGTVADPVAGSGGWLRVTRGGSWLYDGEYCRSANRDRYGPDNKCTDIGFRVVLGPPVVTSAD